MPIDHHPGRVTILSVATQTKEIPTTGGLVAIRMEPLGYGRYFIGSIQPKEQFYKPLSGMSFRYRLKYRFPMESMHTKEKSQQ